MVLSTDFVLRPYQSPGWGRSLLTARASVLVQNNG